MSREHERATMDAAPNLPTSEIVIRELIDGLRRQLQARLGSEHDAEDLAQEACLNFLRAHRNDREIQHPKAYLYRIANNLLYHHYQRRSQRFGAVSDIDALACGNDGFLALTSNAIRREQVNRAAQELSPKCQQALRLRWRDGLRVAEIAEHMDLSIGMVKKYLAQGLAHCLKRLSHYVLADRNCQHGV